MEESHRTNEIVVILGKKGGGKTSLAISLTQNLTRLIVFDYNREYEKGMFIPNPGTLSRELQKYCLSAFRMIYRPDDSLTMKDHFEMFAKIAYAVQNYTLVIEEVDRFSTSKSMPEGLDYLINCGRHRGISLIALSRRAFRVPRDLTSNADKIYVAGPINEPRDIKYLSEFMDNDEAEKIRTLKRVEGSAAEFLEWTQAGIGFGSICFKTKTTTNLPRRIVTKKVLPKKTPS